MALFFFFYARQVIADADEYGAAVLGVPMKATVKVKQFDTFGTGNAAVLQDTLELVVGTKYVCTRIVKRSKLKT